MRPFLSIYGKKTGKINKNNILKELLRFCIHNEGMMKERRHDNEKK